MKLNLTSLMLLGLFLSTIAVSGCSTAQSADNGDQTASRLERTGQYK